MHQGFTLPTEPFTVPKIIHSTYGKRSQCLVSEQKFPAAFCEAGGEEMSYLYEDVLSHLPACVMFTE